MQIKILVDPPEYLNAFYMGEPVKILLKKFSFDQLGEVYYILGQLLIAKKLTSYQPFMQTAMKELVQNAIKATRKRIFYKKNNIDIVKEHDRGLELFRESFLEGFAEDYSIEGEVSFTAEVSFYSTERGNILVTVRNYGEMTAEEHNIVNFMIERGKRSNHVSEILGDDVKAREGGGLGLSMVVILAKNAKLPPDCISYKVKDGFTTFYLRLDVN
jgi:signal transduction histidine kinase